MRNRVTIPLGVKQAVDIAVARVTLTKEAVRAAAPAVIAAEAEVRVPREAPGVALLLPPRGRRPASRWKTKDLSRS